VNYKKILVPLDGSKLAECVLDHVETVAPACGTQEVILISITEPVKVKLSGRDTGAGWRMTEFTSVGSVLPESVSSTSRAEVDTVIGRKYSQACRYLEKIVKQLEKKGIGSRFEVLIGDPASEIVTYTQKNDIDLILMASHGRSGISRWTHGSVADRVFRSGCCPILMVRAPGCTLPAQQ
jgi:nucleotide-binding universal stress UspA family protein